ncbi:MAG: rhomboid family intramembrane serine protease [Candidatus Pacearchaeota archaeon]
MKFISLWLSLVCIVFFIFQFVFPNFTNAFILNQQSFIQPYRFVISIFLHGNFEHLIFNLFALIMFGLILESLIGSKKFLFVFFVSGILTNLITVNFYNSSLGASGAIYGILGTLTIIRPLMTIWVFSLPMPMFFAAIIWIILSIIGIFNPIDNIGHIAHLSGILFGFIFGLVFRLKNNNKRNKIKIEKINIPEEEIRLWEDYYFK